MMTTSQHVVHMRDLLAEFGVVQGWPTPLYNDDSACMGLAVEPRSHHRSVHLTRPMGFVRQLTHDGVLAPCHVRTTDMPADFLTKRLPREQFERCRTMSGMAPLPPHVLTLAPAPAAAQGGV